MSQSQSQNQPKKARLQNFFSKEFGDDDVREELFSRKLSKRASYISEKDLKDTPKVVKEVYEQSFDNRLMTSQPEAEEMISLARHNEFSDEQRKSLNIGVIGTAVTMSANEINESLKEPMEYLDENQFEKQIDILKMPLEFFRVNSLNDAGLEELEEQIKFEKKASRKLDEKNELINQDKLITPVNEVLDEDKCTNDPSPNKEAKRKFNFIHPFVNTKIPREQLIQRYPSDLKQQAEEISKSTDSLRGSLRQNGSEEHSVEENSKNQAKEKEDASEGIPSGFTSPLIMQSPQNKKEQYEGFSFHQNFFKKNSQALSKSKSTDDGKFNSQEREKHPRRPSFILYPDHCIKETWDFILTIMLLYTLTGMPFKLAFVDTTDQSSPWEAIETLSDIVFGIDIIVNFFSAYIDREDRLVTNRMKIAMNYVTTWFFFDFLSVFPFEQIILIDRYNNFIRFTKLPRIYRLIRVAKILRILRVMKHQNRIMDFISDMLWMNAGIKKLCFFLVLIFSFVHVGACIWYLTADLDDSLDNWIDYYKYRDTELFRRYLASVYWVTTTLITIGYGDIAPQNETERLVACLMMLGGVFFYSFSIGSITTLLTKMDQKDVIYSEKIELLNEMRRIYRLDSTMMARVKKALKYGHVKNDNEKTDFLNQMPLPIRIELSSLMFRDMFSGVYFFQNKSIRLLAFLGPCLKPIKIGKDETIFSQGEFASEMYFLKKGMVALCIPKCNNLEFIHIIEGYHFGEEDLIFGETRRYTYRAKSECELLMLGKKPFSRIFFEDFREYGTEIYKIANRKKMRYRKFYKKAIEQFKTLKAKANAVEEEKIAMMQIVATPGIYVRRNAEKSPKHKNLKERRRSSLLRAASSILEKSGVQPLPKNLKKSKTFNESKSSLESIFTPKKQAEKSDIDEEDSHESSEESVESDIHKEFRKVKKKEEVDSNKLKNKKPGELDHIPQLSLTMKTNSHTSSQPLETSTSNYSYIRRKEENALEEREMFRTYEKGFTGPFLRTMGTNESWNTKTETEPELNSPCLVPNYESSGPNEQKPASKYSNKTHSNTMAPRKLSTVNEWIENKDSNNENKKRIVGANSPRKLVSFEQEALKDKTEKDEKPEPRAPMVRRNRKHETNQFLNLEKPDIRFSRTPDSQKPDKEIPKRNESEELLEAKKKRIKFREAFQESLKNLNVGKKNILQENFLFVGINSNEMKAKREKLKNIHSKMDKIESNLLEIFFSFKKAGYPIEDKFIKSEKKILTRAMTSMNLVNKRRNSLLDITMANQCTQKISKEGGKLNNQN